VRRIRTVQARRPATNCGSIRQPIWILQLGRPVLTLFPSLDSHRRFCRHPGLFHLSPSRESGRLTDQWALPDAAEQLLELSEVLRSKLGAPFALDVAEHLDSFCVRGVSALRKADNSCMALIRRVGSFFRNLLEAVFRTENNGKADHLNFVFEEDRYTVDRRAPKNKKTLFP
jgi:hypothetical protein